MSHPQLPAGSGQYVEPRCTIAYSMTKCLAMWRMMPALLLLPLAACPTVDLGETPVSPGACRPDPVYFEEEIWPKFIAPDNPEASCVADGGCHQLENGRSAFRVSVGDRIDYAANYNVVTRFLNCGTPSASALLTKPISGVDSHGGGDLFAEGSPSEEVFLLWFATP